MGCDMHAYIAVKNLDDEVAYRTLGLYTSDDDGGLELCKVYVGRDYLLFGLLTGGVVRGDIPDDVPQMPSPRGNWPYTPRNIMKERQCYGIDGHSDTYFTLKELKKLEEKLLIYSDNGSEAYYYAVNRFVNCILQYCDFCYDLSSDEDIMIVCWFDN